MSLPLGRGRQVLNHPHFTDVETEDRDKLNFFLLNIFKNMNHVYWICWNMASVSCFGFLWPWGMWDLSSPTRDQTHNPCIGRQSLNHWNARKVPGDLLFNFCSRTGVGKLQPVGPVQQAASSLKDCVWLLSCYSSRVELWQRLKDLQSLKYVLSGPLQERLADLCFRKRQKQDLNQVGLDPKHWCFALSVCWV